MDESKKITVIRAGGTASIQVEVFPGDTVEQLITLVAPQLGFPAGGSFELLDPSANPIRGDVYKAVKDGDKITVAQIGQGG